MGAPKLEKLGRYELLVELGRGGMAELYLALGSNVEWDWHKLLAVKRILPHLAQDPQFVEMFLNEARIVARLNHRNVCQLYELDRDGDELFLVMEYLQGIPWDAVAPKIPPGVESLRMATAVLSQACEGLHHAHTLIGADGNPSPIVHRDVSPQNLFVTVDGTCKVLDFGVAKNLEDRKRTRTGVLKGKVPYMAPEMIRGEPLDPRADVFALGIVLWESLAKELLFDRETDFLIWKAISEEEVPRLADRGYPPVIDEVIQQALARDRDQRFRSARALAEAMRAAAASVGGPYDDAAIAATLKTYCGDRLAEQTTAAAEAMRSRSTVIEPSDTIAQRESPKIEIDGGSTVSLRSQPRTVHRPRRRIWPIAMGLGILAATVVVVIALSGGGSDKPPVPAQPPAPIAVVSAAPDAGTVDAAPTPFLTPEMLEGIDPHLRELGKSPKPPEPKPGPRPGPTPPPPSPRLPPASAQPPDVIDPFAARTSPPAAPPPDAPSPPVEGAPGLYSVDFRPYATIFVDGVKRGDTPLFKLKLAPGPHEVRAVRADGHFTMYAITITAGAERNDGVRPWLSF